MSIFDSLPPPAEQIRIAYRWAHRRARIYRPEGKATVIVVTEFPGDTGTSITNAAERVHAIAWHGIGAPWPARFVEHYAGTAPWNDADRGLATEHADEVHFPSAHPGESPFVMSHPQMMEVLQFGPPTWSPLTYAGLMLLLGARCGECGVTFDHEHPCSGAGLTGPLCAECPPRA